MSASYVSSSLIVWKTIGTPRSDCLDLNLSSLEKNIKSTSGMIFATGFQSLVSMNFGHVLYVRWKISVMLKYLSW